MTMGRSEGEGPVKIRLAVALAVGLGCLYATSVLAEDSYVCVGEHATGFTFDETNKTWSTAYFNRHKWMVKKSADKLFEWEVVASDEKLPMAKCEKDFNARGLLWCDGLMFFGMSKVNLRYISSYTNGYWNDVLDAKSKKYDESTEGRHAKELDEAFSEGANTPYMEIGTCSKMPP
jgi:hypothetical protein